MSEASPPRPVFTSFPQESAHPLPGPLLVQPPAPQPLPRRGKTGKRREPTGGMSPSSPLSQAFMSQTLSPRSEATWAWSWTLNRPQLVRPVSGAFEYTIGSLGPQGMLGRMTSVVRSWHLFSEGAIFTSSCSSPLCHTQVVSWENARTGRTLP